MSPPAVPIVVAPLTGTIVAILPSRVALSTLSDPSDSLGWTNREMGTVTLPDSIQTWAPFPGTPSLQSAFVPHVAVAPFHVSRAAAAAVGRRSAAKEMVSDRARRLGVTARVLSDSRGVACAPQRRIIYQPAQSAPNLCRSLYVVSTAFA